MRATPLIRGLNLPHFFIILLFWVKGTRKSALFLFMGNPHEKEKKIPSESLDPKHDGAIYGACAIRESDIIFWVKQVNAYECLDPKHDGAIYGACAIRESDIIFWDTAVFLSKT